MEGEQIGDYVFIEQLGTGSFATVWLAKHTISNKNVGIKAVQKNTLENEAAQTRFNREISLLKRMDHPFIAPLFDIIETAEAFYLVMEYLENGNMLNFVNSQGRLVEEVAKRYFAQIVSAVDYLHNIRFIAHRDLKAENVLLDANYNIRLIDFGLSNQFTRGSPNLITACGSPAYAAPEMVAGSAYTKAADIWSIGVLLYAMVCGNLPFDSPNVSDTLQKIVYSDPVYPSALSRALQDLLKRLLCKSPQTRITIQEVKQHPWFLQTSYQLLMHFPFHASEGWLISDLARSCVDQSSAEEVTKLGLNGDPVALAADLAVGAYTPSAITYRIFRRESITDQLRDLIKNLSKKVNVPNMHSAIPSPRILRPPLETFSTPGVRRLPLPMTELPTIRRLSRPVAVRRLSAGIVRQQSLETP